MNLRTFAFFYNGEMIYAVRMSAVVRDDLPQHAELRRHQILRQYWESPIQPQDCSMCEFYDRLKASEFRILPE